MSDDEKVGSTPPLPDPTRLVFGFAPSVEGDRTRQALVDICRVLGDAVGLDIAPMRVTSYAALERAIVEGRASFGWFPPVVLARLELAGLVKAIAQCTRSGVRYHSSLIARADSPLQKLDEVRGARVAWVDRSSASGYVFPRLLMAAHNMNPRQTFAQELFLQSHAEVVRAVVEGTAEIGATFATLTEDGRVIRGGWTDPDGSNPRPIKVIATFGPIPNDAMAASTALASDVSDALARAAIGCTATPPLRAALRHLFGADSLSPIAPNAYADLRALMDRAIKSGIEFDA
ncbi:MAG: phosphate/phosphite/phosphonate ABC transporter substrate-binding protein [Polyangiales bacterium]